MIGVQRMRLGLHKSGQALAARASPCPECHHWTPTGLAVFFVIQRLLECRGELIGDWLRRPLGSEQGMPGKHLEVRKSGSLEVGTFGKAGFAIVCSNGTSLGRSSLQLRNRCEQVGAPALLVTQDPRPHGGGRSGETSYVGGE